MAETYSTSLKLTLIGDGDLAGTWGDVTNTNLGTLLEQAITGVNGISLTTYGGSSYTLTNYNGTLDDARNMALVFTGTPSAGVTIIAPLVNKFYIVVNNTSQVITMSASGGAITLAIPAGVTAQCYCDAYNVSGSGAGFYSAQTGSAGNFVVNGTLTATGESDTGNMSIGGTLGVTGNSTLGGTLGVTGAQTNSSTISATAFTSTVATGTAPLTVTSTTPVANLSVGGSSGSAAKIANTGGWNITPTGTKLYFNYNGTNVASLDSSGNLIVLANVTAYGTP